MRKIQIKKNPSKTRILFINAEGETRTRTLLPAVDFESTASTISPLRLTFSVEEVSKKTFQILTYFLIYKIVVYVIIKLL